MCIEDIRMGRSLGADARQVAAANGTRTSIASADTKRTRLVVSADGAFPCFIAPAQSITGTTGGFLLTTSNPIRELRIEELGKVLTEPWVAWGVGGVVQLMVLTATFEGQ